MSQVDTKLGPSGGAASSSSNTGSNNNNNNKSNNAPSMFSDEYKHRVDICIKMMTDKDVAMGLNAMGDIVICVKRLCELLKDAQNVAKGVRNVELVEKLRDVVTEIKRDVIFNASLYYE